MAQALGVTLDSSGEVEGSEEGSGWEGAGEGGSALQAAGVLEALPALRAAAAPALQALLARYTRRPDLLYVPVPAPPLPHPAPYTSLVYRIRYSTGAWASPCPGALSSSVRDRCLSMIFT